VSGRKIAEHDKNFMSSSIREDASFCLPINQIYGFRLIGIKIPQDKNLTRFFYRLVKAANQSAHRKKEY